MPEVIKTLRAAHRWIGLALALPMISMGVTGVVLVTTPVFEGLTTPPPSLAEGAVHAPDEILAAARAAVPAGLVPSRVRLGESPRAIVSIDMVRPQQRMAEARLFVDPVTLAVVERQERPGRLYAWVHGLHEFLLMPGPFGRSLIGCFGIGLFAMGLLGIPLWWPVKGRVKAAFRVSAKARGLRLQRELHGAAGIWVVGMLLLQSLGGITLAFPQAARTVLGVNGSLMPRARGLPAELNLRTAIAAAQARMPHASVRNILLPGGPGRPVVMWFLPDGETEGSPWGVVAVDPAGPVLSVQDPRTAPFGARLLATLRMLHFGEGLGPVWRACVGVAGLSLPLFAITGVWMWLLRRRNRRRVMRMAAAQGARS